jgi:uncharacterized membrane protein YdjX (TVP38/TMEM64 family)
MTEANRATLLRIAALVLVIAITGLAFVYRDQVKQFEAYGYPGIFVVSLITNASLFLPIPGVLITSAMGAVFDPFWVAVTAGTGAAIGELSGYLAGFSGQAVIQNRQWYDRLQGWMRRYGAAIVLVMAFVPNPLFDMTGLVAGGLKMPVQKFLFWSWVGKVLKMMLFAYGGASLLRLFPF